MKILLVGGLGFIGSHVCRKLRDRGHDVLVIDSKEAQVHGGSHSFGLRAGLVSVTDTYDCLVHLGAKVGVGQSMYQIADYVECNSADTARLLENVRGRVKRVVVASSMSVYGEGQVGRDWSGFSHPDTLVSVPTKETQPPNLRSIYALTKFDQEQLCLIWGKAYHVPTVALRFFNTYGPGQALSNPYTGALAIFAMRLLNGNAPVIYEDGQQTRDFVYVDDVAEAVVHAATQGEKVGCGVYNVGTGVPTTIERVARLLTEKMGADIAPVITGEHREGDIRHCYADVTKLKATGWEAKVGLEEGIGRYVDWLKEQPVPPDRFEVASKELKGAGLVR